MRVELETRGTIGKPGLTTIILFGSPGGFRLRSPRLSVAAATKLHAELGKVLAEHERSRNEADLAQAASDLGIDWPPQ